MATMDEISAGARTYLRDFPLFFEIDQGPLNTLTIRLPHPLVNSGSLGVYLSDINVDPIVTTATKAWQCDERNGLLKITDDAALGKRVLISGYHYSWFLDSDLAFHAEQVWGEMTYYGDLNLRTLQAAQMEVVELGTVLHALWSLSLELALDIDVSTPEGMFIPARQRYMQVVQMLNTYSGMYEEKAGLMNMGLGALEQFRLRRVAYMTGRFVPVYRDREIDDPRPPERLYPPIPEGVPASQQRTDVVEGLMTGEIESWSLGPNDGWYRLGTSG